MKNYDEIARDVFAYRDEYVARQKRTRKTVMRITSVACAVALVAGGIGVWLSRDSGEIPLEEPNVTTTAPTEDDAPGIGGDGAENEDACTEHNFMYHLLNGNFTAEEYSSFKENLGENYNPEDYNIVAFVKFHGFTREEYMERVLITEDNIDEIYDWHGSGCPYTKRQWVNAIFGDDVTLTEWVFAHESTWPDDNGVWPPEGDWPPEGYGFGEVRPTTEPTTSEPTTEPTIIVTQPITPSTTDSDWELPTAGRDEFGNTTAKP